MDIQNKLQLNDLFLTYGKGLTKNKYEILSLYLLSDIAESEIALSLKISRQAVHDAITIGIKCLNDFESKFNVVTKQQKIKELLKPLKQNTNSAGKKIIAQIDDIISL